MEKIVEHDLETGRIYAGFIGIMSRGCQSYGRGWREDDRYAVSGTRFMAASPIRVIRTVHFRYGILILLLGLKPQEMKSLT